MEYRPYYKPIRQNPSLFQVMLENDTLLDSTYCTYMTYIYGSSPWGLIAADFYKIIHK